MVEKLLLITIALGMVLSPRDAWNREAPGMGLQRVVEELGDIQSLDVFVNEHVLSLLLLGKSKVGAGSKLAYVRSDDGGETWSAPALVNGGRAVQAIARRGNDAQIAGQGNRLVAAWQELGETPGAGPIRVAYSHDGGKHWIPGASPVRGDPTNNQSFLDLAADKRGNFHIVWLDDREERGDSQGLRYAFSTDVGRHWRGETTIDPIVCTCCWNRLNVSPNGELSVLYRDGDPHDMKLSRRSRGRWQDVGTVGSFNWKFAGCPHCGGGLADSPRGANQDLHAVVWTGAENVAGLYHLTSSDRGANWSSPQPLGGGLSREADVAVSGHVLGVVYSEGDAEGTRIVWRSSRNWGQSWSEPLDLGGKGVEADHPRIAALQGGFRVFWTEKRMGMGKALMSAWIHNNK